MTTIESSGQSMLVHENTHKVNAVANEWRMLFTMSVEKRDIIRFPFLYDSRFALQNFC